MIRSISSNHDTDNYSHQSVMNTCSNTALYCSPQSSDGAWRPIMVSGNKIHAESKLVGIGGYVPHTFKNKIYCYFKSVFGKIWVNFNRITNSNSVKIVRKLAKQGRKHYSDKQLQTYHLHFCPFIVFIL